MRATRSSSSAWGAACPRYLKNTLNWMAYWGGTDNPLVPNTGSVSGFDPASVSSCGGSSTTGTCDGSSDQCFATSNDPGTAALSGYAFIANNAAELEAAFRQAINHIREATYSFTQASVASSRLIDENFLYEATFQPANGEPFWQGHIQKYNINTDGSIGSVAWDAGTVLQSTSASSRSIYTYKAGSLTSFTTSNITSTDLNVADDTRRNEVVGFIRGESAYNPDNWKLGDTFRSNPITVGTPAQYYRDSRDTANAFAAFRTSNARSTANGKRIVVAGANDGQIHAFRTSDGAELWSFIAPNLLSKLKDIAHSSHPTGLTHQYYVDGPISVADVWLGSGDGTTKSASDWKTLLVFAQGRGATQTLWSSSSSCDSGFSNVYSAGNSVLLRLPRPGHHQHGRPRLQVAHHPVGKPGPLPRRPVEQDDGEPREGRRRGEVGRVLRRRAQLLELHRDGLRHPRERVLRRRAGHRQRPVELHHGRQLGPGLCDARDPDDDRLRQRRLHRPGLHRRSGRQPLALQILLRRRRILLLDRQLDRLAALRAGRPASGPSTTPRRRPGTPAATSGSTGAPATRPSPSSLGSGTDRFFGVKDKTLSGTVQVSNLENITSSTYTDDSSKNGWYINLAGAGEKCLSDSSIFGGQVYFTTYTPASGPSDPCSQAGTAKLYAVNYVSGAGSLTGGSRSMTLGVGIPTAPVLSMNPYSSTPDLYVTVSGGAGIGSNTQKANVSPPSIANRTNILHWRDRRIQ